MQVFQPLSWSQESKIKPLSMQTASAYTFERMGHSHEFHSGTLTGCHLCNEPSHKSTLNIPQSAGSGIATKWERLEMTAIQPQSGRSGKIIEEDQ